MEHVAPNGKNYKYQYYNLDAIIAVGYRVNSRQATQFCIWAIQTLKEFIMHWAIHGNTAAELIKNRVDSAKPFMGLTSWKNSPKGKVLKSHVS